MAKERRITFVDENNVKQDFVGTLESLREEYPNCKIKKISYILHEEFVPIQGFPDYEISNTCRVRSLGRCNSIGRKLKQKIMSPTKDNTGHFVVSLRKNGKGYSRRVASLAKKHFEQWQDQQ